MGGCPGKGSQLPKKFQDGCPVQPKLERGFELGKPIPPLKQNQLAWGTRQKPHHICQPQANVGHGTCGPPAKRRANLGHPARERTSRPAEGEVFSLDIPFYRTRGSSAILSSPPTEHAPSPAIQLWNHVRRTGNSRSFRRRQGSSRNRLEIMASRMAAVIIATARRNTAGMVTGSFSPIVAW